MHFRFRCVTKIAGLTVSSPPAAEPGQFIVSPVAEKKLNGLPPGPLYWRIENFPALDQAQSVAAASPTSLAAAVSGKVWLFTLGQKGGTTPGGTKIAEVGPIPVFAAPEYLLRINHAGGLPGSKTPVHSHPGFRVILCACRSGQPKNAAWGKPHGRWSSNGRPRTGHAYGSVQQRDDRSGSIGDVSVGCEQTGLGAGQVGVSDTAPCASRRFRCEFGRGHITTRMRDFLN
jgi:hypothetical protein